MAATVIEKLARLRKESQARKPTPVRHEDTFAGHFDRDVRYPEISKFVTSTANTVLEFSDSLAGLEKLPGYEEYRVATENFLSQAAESFPQSPAQQVIDPSGLDLELADPLKTKEAVWRDKLAVMQRETPAEKTLKAFVERFIDNKNASAAAGVVLIGEATHGTSEFYRFRAEITKALIEQKDFQFVAVEADWPDAYRIHDFVTHKHRDEPHDWEAFARFPTWMWRNQEVLDFIHWLRDFNLEERVPGRRVGFFGLDLYSLFTSINAVLNYLDGVDPETAKLARVRYSCLTPWKGDPANYGRSVLSGRYRSCESHVTQMLREMLQRRAEDAVVNGEELFNAQLNAQLAADAEHYYRIMYYGSDESWNHRDTHMFNTLQQLLDRYGAGSKAVIWEHNSHLGNAAATQFGKHGQLNVGQLCREQFGSHMYAIGQGTDHGTVAAASVWNGPLEIKQVRPSHPESYEHLMHLSEMEAFLLPLTQSKNPQLTTALAARRLERAIGVIYRPETRSLATSRKTAARLGAESESFQSLVFSRTSPPAETRISRTRPRHRLARIGVHCRLGSNQQADCRTPPGPVAVLFTGRSDRVILVPSRTPPSPHLERTRGQRCGLEADTARGEFTKLRSNPGQRSATRPHMQVAFRGWQHRRSYRSVKPRKSSPSSSKRISAIARTGFDPDAACTMPWMRSVRICSAGSSAMDLSRYINGVAKRHTGI